MPKPKAVIFDLDDTLIERRAMMEVFAPLFLHRYFPHAAGAEYDRIYETFLRMDDGGNTARPGLFHLFHDALGITERPSDRELLDFWNEHFADHTVPVPGAEDCLHALKADGCLLGMITNGNPVLQNHKIDHTGFRGLFDNILVSGTFGRDKPDPRIFRASLEALGITADEAIYIGDNLTNDIYGAHGAGMQAVWANYSGRVNTTEFRPDYEIHAVLELLTLNLD